MFDMITRPERPSHHHTLRNGDQDHGTRGCYTLDLDKKHEHRRAVVAFRTRRAAAAIFLTEPTGEPNLTNETDDDLAEEWTALNYKGRFSVESPGYLYVPTFVTDPTEDDDAEAPTSHLTKVLTLADLGVDTTHPLRRPTVIDAIDPLEDFGAENDFVGFHVIAMR